MLIVVPKKYNNEFLFRVLEQYGFPNDLINIVKTHIVGAGSHISISGHESAKIKLKSGIKRNHNFENAIRLTKNASHACKNNISFML